MFTRPYLLLKWITGITAYSIFNWLFDYLLSGWLIWKYGALSGGAVVAMLGLLLDLGTLKVYHLAHSDWLALEYLKDLRKYPGSHWWKKFVAYVLTATPVTVQLIFLSIKFNPFITTVLLRPVNSKTRLTRRGWKVFLVSFFIGQFYWIAVVSGGVYAAKQLLLSAAK